MGGEAWAALEAQAELRHTPCGGGSMAWHVWGRGTPLVLLHGGAGSWLHWLRTIPAFVATRRVLVPDLPGLGASAPPPGGTPAEVLAPIMAGLDVLAGREECDLAGFSFGGVVAGLMAAMRPPRSLTLVGSGGLGVIRGSAPLERVRDKEGAAREAAHRTNLHRWMLADPGRIDAGAVAVQDWNSRHARFDSRGFGVSDLLCGALPGVMAPVSGIWGALDQSVQAEPGRAEAALRSLQPGSRFETVPGAGHWVMWEAAEAFNAALRRSLERTPRHGTVAA